MLKLTVVFGETLEDPAYIEGLCQALVILQKAENFAFEDKGNKVVLLCPETSVLLDALKVFFGSLSYKITYTISE